MVKPTDPFIWVGRTDDEEAVFSPRWHQLIQMKDAASLDENIEGKTVLVGFCSDEGVVRNKGRAGAKEGPDAIRKALANLAVDEFFECYDLGNVINHEGMESAQSELSSLLTRIIQLNATPVVLGGGHEVGFASFKGLFDAFYGKSDEREGKEGVSHINFGVINFDAHLDCRAYLGTGSSGTPFSQSALLAESYKKQFNYAVVGFNPTANTRGVVEFARKINALIISDVEANLHFFDSITSSLKQYLAPLTHVYLTVCLDVFYQCFAPGVSAPPAMGLTPEFVIYLLRWLKDHCAKTNKPIVLFDVAEMNPNFDWDMLTAKLAGRLVHEFCLPVQ